MKTLLGHINPKCQRNASPQEASEAVRNFMIHKHALIFKLMGIEMASWWFPSLATYFQMRISEAIWKGWKWSNLCRTSNKFSEAKKGAGLRYQKTMWNKILMNLSIENGSQERIITTINRWKRKNIINNGATPSASLSASLNWSREIQK